MDEKKYRAMLDSQTESIKAYFSVMLNDIKTDIRELRNENHELKRTAEFNAAEILDLKNKLQSSDREIENLRSQMVTQGNVAERVRILEDDLRRNNIIVDGLVENPGETTENLLVNLDKLFKDTLRVEVEVLEAFRLGSPQADSRQRPRQVLVKFSTYADRTKCFSNKNKLKGTDVFINEHLCKATMMIRKSKMEELKEKRNNGYIAYFSGTRIITKQRTTNSNIAESARGGRGRGKGNNVRNTRSR